MCIGMEELFIVNSLHRIQSFYLRTQSTAFLTLSSKLALVCSSIHYPVCNSSRVILTSLIFSSFFLFSHFYFLLNRVFLGNQLVFIFNGRSLGNCVFSI
jgi:hypothetical protein